MSGGTGAKSSKGRLGAHAVTATTGLTMGVYPVRIATPTRMCIPTPAPMYVRHHHHPLQAHLYYYYLGRGLDEITGAIKWAMGQRQDWR